MKQFIYILITIAIGLIVYNITQVDFEHPLQGDSVVALITILSGFCAIMLLVILRLTQKIKQTLKRKS